MNNNIPSTVTYLVRNEHTTINGYKKYQIALVYDIEDFAPRTMSYHQLDKSTFIGKRNIVDCEKLEFESYPLWKTRCFWLKYHSLEELIEDEREVGVCESVIEEVSGKIKEYAWIPLFRTKSEQPNLFSSLDGAQMSLGL